MDYAFLKTSNLAISSVKLGRIKIYGQKIKAPRIIKIGDVISINKAP